MTLEFAVPSTKNTNPTYAYFVSLLNGQVLREASLSAYTSLFFFIAPPLLDSMSPFHFSTISCISPLIGRFMLAWTWFVLFAAVSILHIWKVLRQWLRSAEGALDLHVIVTIQLMLNEQVRK